MVIIDSGYMYALADKSDDNHHLAIQAMDYIDEGGITTWPVMTEVCHLILNRLGVNPLQTFMSTLESYDIFELSSDHIPKIKNMMQSYRDLPMDLADASLMILAEHLNDGRILTTDRRDFNTYRWKTRHPFINLMDQ